MEETSEQTPAAAPKKDLLASFKAMPGAEKLLAVAGLAILLSFIVDNRWRTLFRFGGEFSGIYEPWKHTLAFIGALLVLVLIITKLLDIKLVEAKLYTKLLILAALLPAIGLLIDELRQFWGFLILASIVVMAYAGAKITSREKIIGG